MTRLISQDIENICAQLDKFDSTLKEKTGHTLFDAACHAAGICKRPSKGLISSLKVGIVPVTCGQGIIEGFTKAVKGILTHIGFDAFVTQNPDASGVAESFENRADILMMADDRLFFALAPRSYYVIDNAIATGKGFAAELDLMAGGLKGNKVLILGCGSVGQSAAEALIHFGARVSAYDVNQKKCVNLAGRILRSDNVNIKVERSLSHALTNHRFVIEATNAPNIIDEKYLDPETFIAAPGMPLGITANAYRKAENRILHDPLQTGVATMGLMGLKVCRPLEPDEEVEPHEQ